MPQPKRWIPQKGEPKNNFPFPRIYKIKTYLQRGEMERLIKPIKSIKTLKYTLIKFKFINII
jgi:hypothetical protein